MAIYKSFIMSNFNLCPLVWMFSCCRTLTFPESKSWSYDIWLLKCFNVLRELTLLTPMQCLHTKNVLMHWETAQYWWDRKWNWLNTVLNLSKATAQKFGIFCPHHIRPIYRKTNLKHWSNHGMARNVNALFLTCTHNQYIFSFFSCVCIYVCMSLYACVYTDA